MEDDEIIELFLARSEQALKETLNKYGRLCKKIALGIVFNLQDAEECINTTLMKLWNAIPPKVPDNFGGYLCSIVRNTAITRYVRESYRLNRETATELSEIIPDERTIEKYWEADRISELLNEFLAMQNKRTREIFVGRYYMNLSVSELSNMTGLTESGVKSRLHRARKELREYLEERGIEI